MFENIENMPPSARVWVYQSDKMLTEAQIEQANRVLQNFVYTWVAHGAGLKAYAGVHHAWFIILAVDETYYPASGCSIDESIICLHSLQKQLGLNLFQRTNIAYRTNENGGQIAITSTSNLPDMYKKGVITDDALIFNNIITTKSELDQNWELPLSKTWAKQLCPA